MFLIKFLNKFVNIWSLAFFEFKHSIYLSNIF